MKLVPYLTFNGNAEEAFNFYLEIFGAESGGIMYFHQIPQEEDTPPIPENWKNKVLHASMSLQGDMIYLSDDFPGRPFSAGENIAIHINCDSEEQLRNFFEQLADGGNISMPLDKMFWNSIYGALTDKFGISWSLDYQLS